MQQLGNPKVVQKLWCGIVYRPLFRSLANTFNYFWPTTHPFNVYLLEI